MMFARVFLIFLVPLLVHGAPTPGGGGFNEDLLNPTLNNESPQRAKIWEEQPGQPPAPHSGHSNSPPPPDQTVAIHPDPVHESKLGPHVSSRSDISKTTCTLQKDFVYYSLGYSRSIRKRRRPFRTSTIGIATTRFGVMIYIPERTTIRIVSDSDESFVPPSTSGTDIKIMDKNDPLLRAIVVFQEGATFATKPNPYHFRRLESTVSTKADRIVLTREGKYFFLPKDTTVILLPDNVTRVPPLRQIKEISNDEQTRVKRWCDKLYDEFTLKDGEKKEPREEFDDYCFYWNLWYASEEELVTVHVRTSKIVGHM